MEGELGIIWLGCCSVVLPIVVVWLGIRGNMNETNKRTQIILAALEKNPDIDMEALLEKLSPKKKLIKEKLLNKLLWGVICLIAGIVLVVAAICSTDYSKDGLFVAGIVLAVGIALVSNFFIGRRMLAKEIEAEERGKTQKRI